jgi:hypothetical protein
MNPLHSSHHAVEQFSLMQDGYDYLYDASQRSILFMDTMRKRGNLYFQNIQDGKPPVLAFDYEIILTGEDMTPPVNFALARIYDRRNGVESGSRPDREEQREVPFVANRYDPKKRPIIIVDPRAGHGPGIGGSKRDSEIGMALNQGHPVYFILFTADPVLGQTLEQVHNAQINFVSEVSRRHPEAQKPAIIGNCQAGWASALIGADRPDITGPLVFNGSPLSYWAGVDGKNPMRYRGGLSGGVWVTSLLSDLGNGLFDGANLVAGFEGLNPANTLWNKQYHIYANVDTEEQRYLEFERWWNGYYKMTREEIHTIVDKLFIGNQLEQGTLELDGRRIDLKNLKEPVLVFASSGDNITPPQQALNWIVNVWGTVDEIKRRQQVIVYMVHDTIGHLGIFVSGKVSKKEHKEIIGSIDLMGYLSPGLYEMVIDSGDIEGDHTVRFEEREMADILALDDGQQDEADFVPVAAVSRFNDRMYRTFLSPWIRLGMTDQAAKWIRRMHPLRMSRYAFADGNPWMAPFKHLAPAVKAHRRPVSPDNPYVKFEKGVAQAVTDSLNMYRDLRDQTQEFWFKAIYGHPLMQAFFPEKEAEAMEPDNTCMPDWLEAYEEGGFPEGVARIMVAMAQADEGLQRRVLKAYDQVAQTDRRLAGLTGNEFQEIIRKQACILNSDEEKALKGLEILVPEREDRLAALAVAEKIAMADHEINDEQGRLMERLRDTLG